MLKQNRNAPIRTELQVCIIYAVVNDLLRDVPVERISEFEQALFEHLTVQQPEIPENIRATQQLTKELETELRQAIEVCKERFIKK